MPESRLGIGQGTVFCKFDGFGDLLRRLQFNLSKYFACRRFSFDKSGAIAANRIPPLPLLNFLFRTDFLPCENGMAFPAITLAFEERGTQSRPCTLCGLVHGLEYRLHIIP